MGLPIGKLALNIVTGVSGAEAVHDFHDTTAAKAWYTLLHAFASAVLPRVQPLAINIEKLNEECYYPIKDHDSNSLEYGLLQCARQTLLLCDESEMNAGKLNEAGLKKMQAIQKVFNSQLLNYDFQVS